MVSRSALATDVVRYQTWELDRAPGDHDIVISPVVLMSSILIAVVIGAAIAHSTYLDWFWSIVRRLLGTFCHGWLGIEVNVLPMSLEVHCCSRRSVHYAAPVPDPPEPQGDDAPVRTCRLRSRLRGSPAGAPVFVNQCRHVCDVDAHRLQPEDRCDRRCFQEEGHDVEATGHICLECMRDPRFRRGTDSAKYYRSVAVQSQCTYTSVRGAATPRFSPVDQFQGAVEPGDRYRHF